MSELLLCWSARTASAPQAGRSFGLGGLLEKVVEREVREGTTVDANFVTSQGTCRSRSANFGTVLRIRNLPDAVPSKSTRITPGGHLEYYSIRPGRALRANFRTRFLRNPLRSVPRFVGAVSPTVPEAISSTTRSAPGGPAGPISLGRGSFEARLRFPEAISSTTRSAPGRPSGPNFENCSRITKSQPLCSEIGFIETGRSARNGFGLLKATVCEKATVC